MKHKSKLGTLTNIARYTDMRNMKNYATITIVIDAEDAKWIANQLPDDDRWKDTFNRLVNTLGDT